jgi:hypothetical protein
LVLFAGVVWLWRAHRHDERIASGFDSIMVGMSDEHAIELLGKPNRRARCGTDDYYDFVDAKPGSADCLFYASSLAPLIPQYHVLFLGPDNRVIDKYVYSSP